MSRQSPRKRNGHTPLEESWALENQLKEDIVRPSSERPKRGPDLERTSDQLEDRPRRRGERRRNNYNNSKTSAEPDLIMPSINNHSMDGSWVGGNVRKTNPTPRTTRRTRAQQERQKTPELILVESESATGTDDDSGSEEDVSSEDEEPPKRTTRARAQQQQQQQKATSNGHQKKEASKNGQDVESIFTIGFSTDGRENIPSRQEASWVGEDVESTTTTAQGYSSGSRGYPPLFASVSGSGWFTGAPGTTEFRSGKAKGDKIPFPNGGSQFRPMDPADRASRGGFLPFASGPEKKSTSSRPNGQIEREREQSERRQPDESRTKKQRKERTRERRRSPLGNQEKGGKGPFESFQWTLPKPHYHEAAQNGLSRAWSLITWIWSWFAPTVISIATFFATFAFLMAIIGYLISMVTNSVSTSLSSAVAPLCSIPGMSMLPLGICSPGGFKSHGKTPVEFDQMMDVQAKFEEVLDEQSVSFNLPLDMKRGETAIRDLRNIVKFSSIPSKNELVLEFDNFIETSRMAIYDLTKYNSHIGRAVDNVLATTRWTQRTLDDIGQREASKGRISSAVESLGFLVGRGPVLEQRVLDQYITHARTVEEEINRLIIEAQSLLRLLRNLEERLDTVHGIVTRDTGHTLTSREELTKFWAKILGSSSDVKALDRRLALLDHIGKYRKSAIVHVSHTLIRLQEIGAGLEDLRERVIAPEEAMMAAGGKFGNEVPLSIHLESIESGVQRLEAGRSSARKVESDFYRKSIRGHEEGEKVYGMLGNGAEDGLGDPPGVGGRITAVPGAGTGPRGPTITRTTVVRT
ncbi:MAG: protein transporter tim10 [Watsoniomyces obsoletus]|nr:MAG: protein transporter tim10 [Watsoniomyces obsoletus]